MRDEYYDALSAGYNELYGDEQVKKIDFLLPWIRSIEGLTLDLGCGTGLIQRYFVPDVSADSSVGMLKINPSRDKVCADARFLPFKSDAFDCVVSLTMLQDVVNKSRVLKEIARVCKGNVILTILKRNYDVDTITSLVMKHFDIIVFDEAEMDYCYYLKRKELVKKGKLRIKL